MKKPRPIRKPATAPFGRLRSGRGTHLPVRVLNCGGAIASQAIAKVWHGAENRSHASLSLSSAAKSEPQKEKI
jgi:hypothetical protein